VKALSRRAAAADTRKVRIAFGTVKQVQARIRAVAAQERMTPNDVIAEALHIHLHKLETSSDPRLRRKSVCWSCGERIDASTAPRRARK
jgi:hypothetical protein